jgi:hypothetical protein
MHPLPHALTQLWQRGEIDAAALPRLLALIERRLKPGDYLGLRGLHTRRYLRIMLWMMLVLDCWHQCWWRGPCQALQTCVF